LAQPQYSFVQFTWNSWIALFR